ncbi:hypothetical protein JAAARDRAFT_192104 [Jaapia argillacea MUCL 33604]|uniref:Uncharacterized protein n=1 Tax=Jaapia argillacea MUCL 33604 TaxID=933084 RepID=A0A067Q0C0_9AGAM|nr:hypothetical protein JAAARDRAFT_192104 [Jaapia argillacea MUCL 33604]
MVRSNKKDNTRKAGAGPSAGPLASGSKIRKLNPPRPFPTVPTSVSATGPRSAHSEGKNFICVTRKLPLGAYLRRCKDLILKDGYKTLHLSALGAAIPHLLTLTTSLPGILPFAPDEIHTQVLTGTVELMDEVIPEDEDEDITYRTRGKSSISVVIKIGEGDDEDAPTVSTSKPKGKGKGKGKGIQGPVAQQQGGDSNEGVFQEPDQDDMDMS